MALSSHLCVVANAPKYSVDSQLNFWLAKKFVQDIGGLNPTICGLFLFSLDRKVNMERNCYVPGISTVFGVRGYVDSNVRNMFFGCLNLIMCKVQWFYFTTEIFRARCSHSACLQLVFTIRSKVSRCCTESHLIFLNFAPLNSAMESTRRFTGEIKNATGRMSMQCSCRITRFIIVSSHIRHIRFIVKDVWLML